ncbi:single-stranded DNA-binding protein [Canibacter sp. lx-72]|uniref:single-stranded DNA-binding protein n=1 Tax=Canibacter zhuwentaonis TaxID=2837491 RepID=UPI001BDC3BB3|nr:single-stranded DNA-binding protein [Canibacter zhuwentaonis]MBT1018259.1 single-stranded DNA-binding protein [Canibacter zhuwentaonis]
MITGGAKCTFRLAENDRRYDRTTGQWVETETSWYTVNSNNSLGNNAAVSIAKGQRVIVTGRMRVRNWSKSDGRSGTVAELDADGLGHDLRFGITKYERTAFAKNSEAKSADDANSELATGAAAVGNKTVAGGSGSVSSADQLGGDSVWKTAGSNKELQTVGSAWGIAVESVAKQEAGGGPSVAAGAVDKSARSGAVKPDAKQSLVPA